jgi:DNA-binding PadR family transcriptional regulator
MAIRSAPPAAPALTPAMLHILHSLLDQERHGYAIMQVVEALTHGEMRLGPGTLYTSIRKLLDAGLIEESDDRPDEDDERRRYYRISAGGREAVRVETDKLARLVKFARAHSFAGVRL